MAREDVRHGDEPVGITIRKRAQENAVDDAKDGSVSTTTKVKPGLLRNPRAA
jgi:hypothetical protein